MPVCVYIFYSQMIYSMWPNLKNLLWIPRNGYRPCQRLYSRTTNHIWVTKKWQTIFLLSNPNISWHTHSVSLTQLISLNNKIDFIMKSSGWRFIKMIVIVEQYCKWNRHFHNSMAQDLLYLFVYNISMLALE